MANQAARRGDMAGGRNDDRGRSGHQGDWSGEDYELRPGHHYAAAQGDPEQGDYDPRAYAPNPDEPYGWDDEGRPLYYQPDAQPARPSGGRGGVVMVAIVLAVALIGGAGAFGYKMMSGPSSGEAPLIKAETEPFKSTPEKPAAEAAAQNKAIYDRVDPAGARSKVVSREEEPVDLPSAPLSEQRQDGSRIILPGGPASAQPVPPSTNGSEPRRVKTMAIGPDTAAGRPTDPIGARPADAPKPAVSDPIAETARTGQAPRASEFDNGILSGEGGSAARSGDQRLAAVPGQPVRPSAQTPRPATPAIPAPAPQAQAPRPAPAPAPAPVQPPRQQDPQQVAAVAPRAPIAAPAARPAAGGGFVVQVTSQRSEQDAKSAYSNLQKRFPQVLGPYQASIQTATVGDRGTYFRVRVGPFANSTDASTVCNNLRAAGGDCVVSRN